MLPESQRFVFELLRQSLDGGLEKNRRWLLLQEIESLVVGTGVSNLAERRDHCLGKPCVLLPLRAG
ncbi:MAG: hypothetical protein N838_07865 [Thiohalocapsa sp. PB-PSB1]|jgi:hypothetical protein|nr:MAG: hypothetical protein N838_15090 [Thiohalocapsa sp. PB-PSB1]QQO53294.1 MAG: hypothetical protein N838_07865 [Thiohalocapsa sp. PB-PSB1]